MKPFLAMLPLVALLLTGCNFEAPLTEKPTRDVDPALPGSWFSLKNGDPFDVFKLSTQEYLVVDDGEPYVCTHSDIEGVPFVSCRRIGNDDHHGRYAYVAFRIDHGELVLTPLNDALPIGEHASIDEVRAELTRAAKAGNALDPDPQHETRYRRKD